MKGAGGTSGGIGSFFIGLIMMCGGFYMLLNAIKITSSFGMGHSLYRMGGMNLTSGMIMIPFMFGVGLMFYNAKNIFGWILTFGSLVALIFGVISSINFRFTQMSAFELIVILVLSVGGLGIFLRSLKTIDSNSLS
ncbi:MULTISPECIES: hypothetical protein [unclassified Shewanella]|uniref:hypothetical protein n=1 Tax=unclassified Shewanella TaxID=196818 RepID=UPI000C862F6C|nr:MULTISPECIES: hypothetical protein [unclassified Shewanella]MDO6619168.1 hypothetical protein [Shewanella sp. 6_MG-2023]MDO6641325.1 hypothetical protein [Shewanella sp. 5_MG-2023]MDO6677262.1 hypothetical protein [Shewanella sp. 4_MG-2023]MDO6773924.1 hypothetical protein [Shewanella sp. 3_MG-2023]PMG31623.1 hypothetical protein BCU94_07775 [Shewanella sp. 10N.286.52.C2]